jgi:hypothetical protein
MSTGFRFSRIFEVLLGADGLDSADRGVFLVKPGTPILEDMVDVQQQHSKIQ